MNTAYFDGIVVIQCAGTKQPHAGTFEQYGLPVEFVAHPELAPKNSACHYAHPDDPTIDGKTWREKLLVYNNQYRETRDNPLGLLEAGQLYRPCAPFSTIYRDLAEKFQPDHVFILSAGWGLISAKFLTPSYDITFSNQVKVPKWKKRRKRDSYNDLNQTDFECTSTILFLGGNDYLPLFYRLTRTFECKKIVFHKSRAVKRELGYEFRCYSTGIRNWHYDCAKTLISGKIQI